MIFQCNFKKLKLMQIAILNKISRFCINYLIIIYYKAGKKSVTKIKLIGDQMAKVAIWFQRFIPIS